jgi:transposase
MAPRYRITLTGEEREALETLTRTGKTTAHRFVYARALLLCDLGTHSQDRWKVAEVADALGISERTVERLKQRFVEEGLEVALGPVARTVPRKLVFDGRFEARLIALACSPAPEGRGRWTMRLLAQKVIELQIAPTVSLMTVQRTLKKTRCSLT